MNKEFRVWNGSGMYYGGFGIHATGSIDITNSPIFFNTENMEVMQFTGLLDKHGKKVFEGDILDLHSTVNGVNLFEVYYNEPQARFSIKYCTDRMPKRSLEYEYSVSDFFKPCEFSGEVDYEVVGNIFEPELIKK